MTASKRIQIPNSLVPILNKCAKSAKMSEKSNTAFKNVAAQSSVRRAKKRPFQDSNTDVNDDTRNEDRNKISRLQKRILVITLSDSDSDIEEIITKFNAPQKNLLKKNTCPPTSDNAASSLAEHRSADGRQKKINDAYEVSSTGDEIDDLVLEFDEESKKPMISVNKYLMKLLEPHQIQGIKFMWDLCFESLESMRKTKGSGCILAHHMGFDKPIQVVTLSHMLFTCWATRQKPVLIVCRRSKIFNWTNSFKLLQNIKDADKMKIYKLTDAISFERHRYLANWYHGGGVMIITDELFCHLGKSTDEKATVVRKYLTNPGSDLIICDEGLFKKSDFRNTVRNVKTLRRVVLTSSFSNNRRVEFFIMQFVKPDTFGKEKFKNIEYLSGTNCAQIFDYSVLESILPPKQEYVIFVKLNDIQIQMYRNYLENEAQKPYGHPQLFSDFEVLQLICTHPASGINYEKYVFKNEKQKLRLRVYPKDKSDKFLNNKKKKNKPNIATETNPEVQELEAQDRTMYDEVELICFSKFLMFLEILKESEEIGDKLVVFARSTFSIELIERLLKQIDTETQRENNNRDGVAGRWSDGLDYFKINESTSIQNLQRWCDIFNDPSNTRARLSLIAESGNAHLRLTGANRVIIFESSFTVLQDSRKISFIYRIGQKKKCYVYRLLAAGTMEEKLYKSDVNKVFDDLYKLELKN